MELYADGTINKEILKELIKYYEPFIKKLYGIVNRSGDNSQSFQGALGKCYNELFRKLTIGRIEKDKFFDKDNRDKPVNESNYFESFLSDNTKFGKYLHASYFLRNSDIHNDTPIIPRDLTNHINALINSYFYFIFRYFDDLDSNIDPAELETPLEISIKDLASLSGGAVNFETQNEVKRANIIQTIESKIADLDMIFIEGEEGIGKTTILKQFIRNHSDKCFAYFIDGKDSNTYTNLSILKAFCSQLHFINKGNELEDEVDVNNYTNEDWLKDYFYTERIRNLKQKNFYFIIDGLDEITEDRRNEVKELIIDKIPYDKKQIKLIIAGKQNTSLIKSCKYDKYDIPYLSENESKEIFGNNITVEEFEKINIVCKNNAGRIVFFRDLVTKVGLNIDVIIDKLSSDLSSLYNYLWNEHTQLDSDQKLILAIIAFDEEKYDAKKISKVLNFPEKKVIDALYGIPIIKKNSRGTYEFIFEGFVEFVKIKLNAYKLKIDKIIIDYLLNNLNSTESLVRLPEIYQKSGKKDDLLNLLSDERWRHLLRESEKISVVSRVSNVTLETIQGQISNKYIPSILKYSVLKSALKELSRSTVWQFEIAASLVLEDYMGAENLANIAFLKEDKLKMYAAIAKAYIEKKDLVPADILKKIEVLFEDIDSTKDFKNIKESSLEIASLLMYSIPRLAFRLIEDLTGTLNGNDNAFDWALAQISLSVHSNIEKLEDISKEDINTKVYSKIRNPKIKEFTDAILYLSENQTSTEIIDKIIQLESTSQKMFLIRNWISNNKENDDVDKVIELGLELVVNRSDSYVPKSSDYKIFALPLPHFTKKDKVYDFIKRIEQYTSSIEANSSTVDLVTINLLITRAVCNFEFDKGEEKLLEIHEQIDKLPDLALKCTCLAIFANEATKIVKLHEKNLDMYLDASKVKIQENIDKILEQTAFHFEIVQSIITNLVRLHPKVVVSICDKLNKSIDRDNAYLESLTTYLRQSFEKIDFDILDQFLNKIVDFDIKKIALGEIIDRIERDGKLPDLKMDDLINYFSQVEGIIDNRAKVVFYVKIISVLEKNDRDYEEYYNKLIKTWRQLEKSVFKIELGYEIAYNAAFLKNKTLAREMLRSSKREKDEPGMLLDSPSTTAVYISIIELTLRHFSGLLKRQAYTNEDIEKLNKIISSLPSERQQLNLWSQLILLVIPKLNDEDDLVNKLTNQYIIPKLSKIRNKNERINTIIDIIIVLYFKDKNLPNLNELPSSKLKDIALAKICKYLLNKCLPDDVCDNADEGFSVSYDQIKEILELTGRMNNDYFIAHEINEIRRSVLSKNTRISFQQRIDIIEEFNKIAKYKLPDINNIRHNGYRILVNANSLAIQPKIKLNIWEGILEEIDSIPNLSDKIFLWDVVAELLPEEYSEKKKILIEKAVENTYKLPSFLDTVGRIEMIFYTLHKKNIKGIGLKKLLEDFIKVINKNSHSPFLKDNYKNILDVAYSTDPLIAKALVNSFDKDVARVNTGAFLTNHLNFKELESKIKKKAEIGKSEQRLLEENEKYFFDVIDKKFAKLNASRTNSDNDAPKDMIYQLKMASEYSIYESQNVFSYFIERVNILYENTDESMNLIRKSFLELVEVCNLVKLLSIRNAEKINSLLDVLSYEKEHEMYLNNQDTLEHIDQETINLILKLKEMGKSSSEISVFTGIDYVIIEEVNIKS
ncbi:MAG: AAA family ATPase [Bacteroidota bacterium]|nr:AAA family ATPase [Bacteroidota bacterium]